MDIPLAAYPGAKLGVLLTLAHNLYHFAYDGVPDATFLTHRLVELVGFPCAGLILAGSIAVVYNRCKLPLKNAGIQQCQIRNYNPRDRSWSSTYQVCGNDRERQLSIASNKRLAGSN